MPLREFSAVGRNLPVAGIRRRLLEADVSGPRPEAPHFNQTQSRLATSLARPATNLLEASDNPPVSPHKSLRTELPSEAAVRRSTVVAKREARYLEWVDQRNRGEIFDFGLS